MVSLAGLLAVQARVEEKFGSSAVVAVLASSYAFTYLTNIVGYPDIILAAVTLGLLLIRNSQWRFYASLFIVPLAMLAHEGYLILFPPVLLLSFRLDRLQERSRKTSVYVGVIAAAAAILAVVTSFRPGMSMQEVEIFRQQVSHRVDFWVQPDVFETLGRSLHQNVTLTRMMMSQVFWRRQFVASSLALLPVLAFLMRLTVRALRALSLRATTREAKWFHVKLCWQASHPC